MRRLLDGLYALTAALAALALVGIAGLIIAQVVGRWVGVQVRSADEFAGYALVATAFLALGPTYRAGEHIRVSLLVERLTGGVRRGLEILLLAIASVIVGWGTWWTGRLVWDSYRFHEMSQGLVPVPLWLPQASMFIGLVVLLIAFLDDLVVALRGGTPSHLAVKAPADGPVFER